MPQAAGGSAWESPPEAGPPDHRACLGREEPGAPWPGEGLWSWHS